MFIQHYIHSVYSEYTLYRQFTLRSTSYVIPQVSDPTTPENLSAVADDRLHGTGMNVAVAVNIKINMCTARATRKRTLLLLLGILILHLIDDRLPSQECRALVGVCLVFLWRCHGAEERRTRERQLMA